MSPTVEGAGVELAYEERGEGPGVVLVHGIASTSEDWADLAGWAAHEGARVVTYDRRGYGGSGAPEPYERTTINEQAEDLSALIRRLDLAPVTAVGANVGTLALLDVRIRHRGLVRQAVLLTPPLYAFVPEATQELAEERLALETAVRDGEPGDAVELYMKRHGNAAAPPSSDAIARARRWPRAFFADYGSLATLPLTRGDLRGLDVPIAVVKMLTPASHDWPAADALIDLAPRAEAVGFMDAMGWMRRP